MTSAWVDTPGVTRERRKSSTRLPRTPRVGVQADMKRAVQAIDNIKKDFIFVPSFRMVGIDIMTLVGPFVVFKGKAVIATL